MLDKFRETAITWDKANRKVYEPLRVSAGDNKGRKLSVQVVNGGVVENITGSSLSLFWETRDKERKGLDVFTAVDATKGEFEIYYTTGMLSNEGVLNANLVLVDTSGRVVSEPFTITVFKGIDDDAIQSEDSFTALTEALIDISNLEQNYAPRLNDLTAQLQQITNGINKFEPVTTPDGFNWIDHPLKNKIYTNREGTFLLKDFDMEIYKSKGLVMYVDKNNGLDTNDGLTLEKAKKTIKNAYDSGAIVIKVAEGIYHNLEGLAGTIVTRNIAIEAIDGHNVTLTRSEPVNWQPHSGNTYYGNTTSYVMIKNPSRLNEKGEWLDYKRVNTVAEVENTPGSFAIVDGRLYLQTHDGTAPNVNNVVRFTTGNLIYYEGAGKIFLKNLKVFGGTRAFYAGITNSSDKLQVFAEKCDFRYSTNSDHDVVRMAGVELAIFKNCSASFGLKDGFNYYAAFGISTKAIEIDCVGKYNGTEGTGNNQGSTQHAGGKIIRINGDYNNNYGSNIADIELNTQSWNLGCIAFESRSGTNSQRANFFAYGDMSGMWLDGCVGYDAGINGVDIAGGGPLYVRNLNLLSDNRIAENTIVTEY